MQSLQDITTDAVVLVQDPVAPLVLDATYSGNLWDVYGNVQPAPAGVWLIQNARVDDQNRIGAWSLPTLIDVQPGWVLLVNNKNLPSIDRQAAVVWRATCQATGKMIWLTELHNPDYAPYSCYADAVNINAPYPWSSNNPNNYTLAFHDRGNAFLPISNSDIPEFLLNPQAPQVRIASHRLQAVNVCWTWVTHSGESRRSPVTALPAYLDGTRTGYRRLRFQEGALEGIPCGVLGRYLYLEIDGVWRRQIADPFRPPGIADTYLFWPQDNMPILWESSSAGPTPHEPATGVTAWSIASPAQQKMYFVADGKSPSDIDLGPDPYVYGPLVDPWRPGVRGREVHGPGHAGVTIRQVADVPALGDNTPANNHPTYWPLIITENEEYQGTRFSRLSFAKDSSRGPGASHCVASNDWSGGQSFDTRFYGCLFSLGERGGPWKRYGLSIGWESAKWKGQHNASEWKIDGCSFYGDLGLSICGTQAVNINITDCNFLGFPAAASWFDGCAVSIRNLVVSAYETLFSVGWGVRLRVDGMFADLPGRSLVDFCSHQCGKITIDNASVRGFDFLYRAPVMTNHHKLDCKNWSRYQGSDRATTGYHCGYQLIELNLAGSDDLAKNITPCEPTKKDFQQRVPNPNP